MVTALTLHVTIATPYILAVSNQSIVVLFWGATALIQTNKITSVAGNLYPRPRRLLN